MQQSHHLFFQSQCKANPKPNTQSQSSQSSQSVTNSKCASQSVSNSAISNTSNGCNKLPIQFTITTSHPHSTHPHHSSSCPPIITDINTKTNPEHNSNSNHNGNTNHNHNHHQPTKPVKCRSMRHYTANNHIHIKRNSNHKHNTNNKKLVFALHFI